MLKGVNKQVVEVVELENEYFERAILFLRPGRPGYDEPTLRQRAGEYVRGLKYRPRRKLSPWLAGAVLLGAAVLGLLAAAAAGVLPL